MKMGICGIGGRMGEAILRIMMDSSHELTAAFDSEISPLFNKNARAVVDSDGADCTIGKIDKDALEKTDVIIDFSAPVAAMELLERASQSKTAVVIGTTGLTAEQISRLEGYSESIPVLFSPNMSLGVNLLFKLTEIASKALDTDYDPEIIEAHHRYKKDSPSGTAVKLIELVRDNLKGLDNPHILHGREGIVGERTGNEIGVHAVRGGSIIGDHTVSFIGLNDRIELTHKAQSRDVFAGGAVKAAEFLAGKKPGLYNMYDVLGF